MNPWAGCSQELLDAPPRCDPCPPRRLLSRDQGRNGMSIVRDARRSIARRLIASVVLLALSTGAAPKAPLVNFPTEREAQEHCPNDMAQIWRALDTIGRTSDTEPTAFIDGCSSMR